MRSLYNVTFVLHRKRSGEDPRLHLRVRWAKSSQVLDIALGYDINPVGWNADLQRCRKGTFHGLNKIPAQVINREIERASAAVSGAFGALGYEPEPSELRQEIKIALGMAERKERKVAEVMEDFIADGKRAHEWTPRTEEKFRLLLLHLRQWRPSLRWSDLDEAGLTSFLQYIREDLHLANSTAAKRMNLLKWFLKWSAARGLPVPESGRLYQPSLRQAQNRVVFLEWGELMRFWNLDLAGRDSLRHTRDMFCFCCFSSLRWSDVKALQWSDVHDGSIFVQAEKTGAPLEIDLNKWTRELLDRYRPEGEAVGSVFPSLSNAKANLNLKVIARLCGLLELVGRTSYDADGRHDESVRKWELITTHTARRTFICNALAMGIPPQVVMKWTGHRNYATMRPYIDVADDERRKAMSAFDK